MLRGKKRYQDDQDIARNVLSIDNGRECGHCYKKILRRTVGFYILRKRRNRRRQRPLTQNKEVDGRVHKGGKANTTGTIEC